MRETHELCDEHDDVATASLIENWIDETERRIWFLFETGRTRLDSGAAHHRRHEVLQRRRAELHHDGAQLAVQQAEHALDAGLAEGARAPTDRDGRPRPRSRPCASALAMSVPRRKPESTSTGTLPPTASRISGRASMVERPLSSARPPWFDTTMPSSPFSTASLASSAVIRPLTSSRVFTVSRRRLTNAQVSELVRWWW